MKTLILFFICLFSSNLLFAQQNKFVTGGTIEYERSVNTFAVNRKIIAMDAKNLGPQSIFGQAFDQYQKNRPQFVKVTSTLTFGNNKTLFTPVPVENISALFASSACKQINTVYTDFSSNTRTIDKQVFDEKRLIQDTLGKIKWKLTDYTETIAGYKCRRANGVIQDSIYIVAFYTDKIWVSGGPESFSGLPGMILKLLLPYEHITWTATKVTVDNAGAAVIALPAQKAKPITNKEFYDAMKSSVFKTTNQRALYELKLLML